MAAITDGFEKSTKYQPPVYWIQNWFDEPIAWLRWSESSENNPKTTTILTVGWSAKAADETVPKRD